MIVWTLVACGIIARLLLAASGANAATRSVA
jgi:hypothetical protein